MPEILNGLIVRSQSGFFSVDTDTGTLVCQLRGRLKRGAREGDLAAIGDRVEVSLLDEDKGMIEAIEPRQHMFSRMAPTPRGEYQQIIIANPDQAIFVFACTEPAPHLRMLDRFLVISEKQEVPAVIVANKIDLVGLEQAQAIFGHYPAIGYPVLYTSAETYSGIDEFQKVLINRITLLAGPSGTGKSSLLNVIQPGLGLAVQQVSQTTGRGQHTTVARELFPLECGGYVADTPGLKALALWDMEPEEIDGYFPEIRPLVPDCQFNDCTHTHEPGCAVKSAADAGLISAERYDSYLRLRLEDDE
jgi:ribosome biogenesis GTPase